MKRQLVVYGPDAKVHLKIDVLRAEMPHPGWVWFVLPSDLPGWPLETHSWYRVPEGASVELQVELEDIDVMRARRRLRRRWRRLFRSQRRRPDLSS